MITDTIAAIATPPGAGGIGIIRVSGSRAVEVVRAIFGKTPRNRTDQSGRLRKLEDVEHARITDNPAASDLQNTLPYFAESHRVVHGYIFNTATDTVIDEVLVIPMLSPRSYTAEDVIEIHAHSGPIVMQAILEQILLRDVRLAQPGEFTKRAFLNGRIDLTQAEAVADIINAQSADSLKIAVSQGLGYLGNTITAAREELISLLTQIEAAIDFPDETAELVPVDYGTEIIQNILDICNRAIQQYDDAHFLRDGLKIAICGPPNVGKSSLMNRLLEKEKSIVTAFPGTTRDLIEENLNINGLPFIISDTAGMHKTDDPVEKIGIEKAKKHILESDIILFMEDVGCIKNGTNTNHATAINHDPSIDDCLQIKSDTSINSDSGFTGYYQQIPVEVLCSITKEIDAIVPAGKKVILVFNKVDTINKEEILALPTELSNIPVVAISAIQDIGIDLLRKKITRIATDNLKLVSTVVPNLRHKTALKKASTALEQAQQNLCSDLGEETLAIDIKNCIDFLGEITGDTAGVDILEHIFSKFCIGK